jgi:peroxiredoxin
MKKYAGVYLVLWIVLLADLAAGQGTQMLVGSKAPEILLPTPKGDKAALSSLQGKLVLVDFWASWCAPCVQEQPELKKLYKKYNQARKEGTAFEIFGVSLDNKKEAWKKTIRRYDLPWTQVSDLKFWTSPVAKTYEIQALPFNVLVDEKGYILAFNLHDKALDDFIASYLKAK